MSASAALVVNAAVPPTVTVPLSVKLPVVAVATKLPPTPEAAKSNAVAFTTLALAVAPVVLNVTAPVDANVPKSISSFACVVVKLDVVPTDTVPVSVMLPPPAVATTEPLAVNAGNAIAALLNVSVRFRKFVKPLKVGTVAAAFTLRKLKSRTFVAVPPIETVPVKSFACVSKRISDVAAPTAN